jgi:methionyl-tRNA formyltransferase
MVEVLERLDEIEPVPQPEDGVTYAHKIEKRRRGSISRGRRRGGRAAGAGVQPGAGRLLRSMAASGSSCWRPSSRSRRGGPPGTVLDEALTIACGSGAIRADRWCSAPGAAP